MKTTTQELIAAFEDTISEEALMQKTGYSKSALRNLRVNGVIKKWSTATGRKLMYSKSEMATILNRVPCK